ncbi:TonB-dependent receptor [Phenylobacterium sp.]|uniref:TonB-dependent receptor n=1 Tax=Phenylobacterium sp. TaxID=1871053 RepID=UPI0025DDEF86|nr:TonB-dependent receptor [Phenylobacterium sp.]
MTSRTNPRTALALGVSALALLVACPALAAATPADGSSTVGELVVTAQRREEALQDVPIAVSAFSQDMLEKQKIDGGPSLQRAIPNVTFTKGFYAGYNFQIRGIGTKQTSVTGDTSTGVHFNGAPLTENRLFEAEFFDVERVEVLRGPQGTLYGRNATGGVVNVITAKPTGDFEGMIRGEVGTYDTRKLRAMVNIPLMGDVLGLRIAGTTLNRSGYTDNLVTGHDVDGRDLYSTRVSLGFKPASTFRADLVWQHFQEDDDRLTAGKALCTRDNGPATVGATPVTNAIVRGFLSQGCANGSIYAAGARTGMPNSLATLYGLLAFSRGLASGDVYGGTRSGDLSAVESAIDPSYRAKEDVVTLSAAWDVMEHLQLNSLSSYYKGRYNATQDMNGFLASTPFNSTALAPGGIVNDPQLGATNRLSLYNSSQHPAKQYSQEFRLASSYSGPLNFNLGALYLHYKVTQDYYITSPAFTYAAFAAAGGAPCPLNSTTCAYIDPSREPTPAGHGDYLSDQPYKLVSKAIFGEVYYEIADNLKLTGGLRYTDDTKTLYAFPIRLLTPGSGLKPGVPPQYRAEFKEVTGRAGVDWQPDLALTDKTLVYAFYSRGYKGGGPNNIGQTLGPRPFYDPEFVNSYEVGTKNTLMGGTLLLNASAFYYDYQGYQISKFVNRISTTENIDATIRGLELESIWEPVRDLRFNGTLGLLHTRIKNGLSIDPLSRTNGDPSLTYVKTSGAGGCTVPTAALANLLAIIQQQPGAPTVAGVSGVPTAILGACSGSFAALGVTPSEGVAANLKGNKLPGSPNWTVSLGAQYTWELPSGWSAVARGDYFRQGASFSRVFNKTADRLRGWDNTNVSLQLSNDAMGLQIEAYVKNLFNKRPITDTFFVDEALGQYQDAFLLDPRIVGLSVQKKF